MHESHLIIEKAYSIKIDLVETFSHSDDTISMLWKAILTDEGYDWLGWFLYEKDYISDLVGRSDLTAWDENQNPICETLEDLYNYLKLNNYFKV